MFARVSRYQGSPDRIDEAIRVSQDTVFQAPGLRKAYFLVDRQSGRALTITLWESEAALQSSVSSANPIRSQINEALGASGPPQIEVFEVAEEMEGPQP